MGENQYYVYEYFALHDGITQFNDESFNVKKGDIYYVGKGIGNRVTRGMRNLRCEHFKKAAGFGHRIVKEGLSEEESLRYEKELINNYRASGANLTNKLDGNIAGVDIEAISQIKYLILLVKADIIKMSQEAIAFETETYSVLVNMLFNLNESDESNKYNKVLAKCPDNIEYILDEYNTDKLTDRDIKFGNIKYLLNLLEQNVIKTNQKEIADFYGENTTVVSAIKKGKYQNINPIKPNNLAEILKNFDVGRLTETEIKEGSIKYIIDKLIEPKILNMTLADLANELSETHGVNYSWLVDLKRRRVNIKYVKPSSDILANLFSKYHDVDIFEGV